MKPQVPKKIHWVKAVFQRETRLKDNEQVVGKLTSKLLSNDVIGELGSTRLLFDVRGFLQRRVEVKDLNQDKSIIASIAFSWGRTATLQVNSGRKYVWQRKNIWMKEWGMFQVLPGNENNAEVVHYTQHRQLLRDEGEMELRYTFPETALVLLAGLFIRNYFQRRRGAAS